MIYHVCNNFCNSLVHANLIAALSKKNNDHHFVFVPVRKKELINRNDISSDSIDVKYRMCARNYLKYFPLLKVLASFFCFLFALKGRVMPSGSKIIAHNLWSDGMVAFLVSKLKGIDLILTARSTDIYTFLPKLPWYRFLVKLAIRRSKVLIFISEAHRARFQVSYPNLYNNAHLVKVIPNGIDNFWIDNSYKPETPANSAEKIVIYAGSFIKRKNLTATFNSVKAARIKDSSLKLTLVGGSESAFLNLTGEKIVPSWLRVIPYVQKEELINLYRASSVFLMPSWHETFGLVYLEALSQGCALIYTKDEGIDGFFDNVDFAVGVKPTDVQSIAEVILALTDKYPSGVPFVLRQNIIENSSWGKVAKSYGPFL